MHCPISFIPLSELEHPVVFRNQRALVVYDAKHLLTWLHISRRNPVTNERFGSMTPLCDLLLPHRLPHTTDTQLTATQRLLVERTSVHSVINTSVDKLFDWVLNMLFVHFTTAWIMLIMVTCCTVILDSLNELIKHDLELVDMPWMEWIVRQQAMALVYVTRVYMGMLHPLVAYILCVSRCSYFMTSTWCNGLASVKAAPLFRSATGLGIDVLLTVCRH